MTKCVLCGAPTDGALQCPSCRETPRATETRVQHHANSGVYTMPATGSTSASADPNARTLTVVVIEPLAVPRAWTLTVHAPPRTKKNSKPNIAASSPQYARFKQAVKESVEELPVKERPILPAALTYNLRAVFYVDPLGESADLFGLLQAIADALQDAGVVTNDWVFRTVDGSRIVAGDARPRCEVTITPLFT